MKLDATKFSQPERYTQPHPYLPVRVGRKGEIFSQPTKCNGWQSRVLKPAITRNGYEQVCIYVDGKQKLFYVHRLVWETYNQERIPEGMQVNHIDEDKRNNQPSNLEVCTAAYNTNYGTRNERSAKSQINHPKKSKTVLQLDMQGNVIREWPSIMEVERQTGWANGHISKACRGKFKAMYGFRWQFSEK